MTEIVIATGNEGKLREFKRMLEPLGIGVVSQSELCPGLSVEETGTTFEENAFLKAEAVHKLTGRAAIADDSGMCIDALDGAPGVYSARYAGEDTPFSEKMRLLLKELENVPDEKRTARFTAHICYIDETGERIDVEESCEGTVGYAPAGNGGFGFDPIFMVGSRSFSEISDDEKDQISHRGKALRALTEKLKAAKSGGTEEKHANK